MTFAHPWVLLLLAVPVLLAWTVVARAPGIVSPADHTADRASARTRWRRAVDTVRAFGNPST